MKKEQSNLAKIREHFLKTGGASGKRDDSWWNLKKATDNDDTKTIIRVLPGTKGMIHDGIRFFYETGSLHYNINIGGRSRAIHCKEASGMGKCPICLFIAKMKATGSKDFEHLLNAWQTNIYPKRVYWVNLIDRANPKEIKKYGGNKKFIDTILEAQDDPDMGDPTDPIKGHDIVITRKGKFYSYRVRTKSTPAHYDKAAVHKLEDIHEWMSYEDMVQVLKDNFAEELREVGLKFAKPMKEADKPTKKKKKVVKKHIEEDDDESNDEVDDIEDVDTEEEEIQESEEEEEVESDEDNEDGEGSESEDEEDDED